MFKSSFAPVLLAISLVSGFSPSVAFGQQPTPLLTRPEDQLIATLRSGVSLKEKMEACRELSVIGSRHVVAPLAALLSDEDLSHMARYGLEPLPFQQVDQAFREALKTLTGRQLIGVIGSIGVRRDARAVKPLAQFLREADPDVAQAAARALGSIGTSAAAKKLENALLGVPDANRLAFAEALFRCAEQLPRKAARRIYDRLREEKSPHQVRAGALRGAILVRGDKGLKLLRQSIQSDDLILVHAALRAARELDSPEVTEVLTASLAGANDDTQVLVLQTLGFRADPSAIPAMVTHSTTGSTEVRVAAVRALAGVGTSAAVEPLAVLLHDRDEQVAQSAQESLASIPGPEADAAVLKLIESSAKPDRLLGLELVSRRRMMTSVPALFVAAKDPDPELRVAAIRRIGEMGGTEEMPALLDLLEGSSDATDIQATEEALSAVLSRLDQPEAQVAELETRLNQARPAQKAVLVRCLGVVGGSAALKTVCAAMDDPSVRTAAVRTLAAWKTPEAAPELLDLVQRTTDATERTIALRSYLGWASNHDLPAEQRLSMCRAAGATIDQPDEKKLLLGALGRIESLDGLELIAPYLEDAAVREEACAATVAIAEQLLKGDDASRFAPGLVEPLQRATKATASDELTRKLQNLLQQAQAKAGT